jgi:hypothetical protein
MKSIGRTMVVGFGLAVMAWASVQPAAAQYYGNQGYGYERRSGDGYERRSRDGYERRGYERRDSWRGDDRGSRFGSGGGYGRDDGRGGGYGRRAAPDPMAGMSLEERKRAIKNDREAQKKAFKRGQLFR